MSIDSETEIDFDHLNLYVGGDLDLTAEVFGLFQNQVEMWGRVLVADADDDTWTSATHTLKGTAKAVGAVHLADLCEKAEVYVGNNNRLGPREKAVQDIEFRISKVIIEIQRWEYRRKLDDIRNRDKIS